MVPALLSPHSPPGRSVSPARLRPSANSLRTSPSPFTGASFPRRSFVAPGVGLRGKHSPGSAGGLWLAGTPVYGVAEGLAEAVGSAVAVFFLALCLCPVSDTDRDADAVGVGAGE